MPAPKVRVKHTLLGGRGGVAGPRQQGSAKVVFKKLKSRPRVPVRYPGYVGELAPNSTDVIKTQKLQKLQIAPKSG